MASAVTGAVKGGATEDLTIPPIVFPKTSKGEMKKGVKKWIIKNSSEKIIEVSYQSAVDTLIRRIPLLYEVEWGNALLTSTWKNPRKSDAEIAAQWVKSVVTTYGQSKSTLCKTDATAQRLYKDIVKDMRVTLAQKHAAYVAKGQEMDEMAAANDGKLKKGFYEEAKKVFAENESARYVAETLLPMIEKNSDSETFLEALGVPLVNEHVEFIEIVREVEAENKADAAYVQVDKTNPMGSAEQGGPQKPVAAAKGGDLELTPVSTNNSNTQ